MQENQANFAPEIKYSSQVFLHFYDKCFLENYDSSNQTVSAMDSVKSCVDKNKAVFDMIKAHSSEFFAPIHMPNFEEGTPANSDDQEE